VSGFGGRLSPFFLTQDNPTAGADMSEQGIAIVGSATVSE
jgi:hypothetical protein